LVVVAAMIDNRLVNYADVIAHYQLQLSQSPVSGMA
jgi:hypothetical protein